MIWYKATIEIAREQLWLNKDGEYEGVDPDSYESLGIIDEIKRRSVKELKEEIEKKYFNLDKPIGADVQIFEGTIIIQYEGEHDYRTPKKDQIPFIETARIVISKIDEKYVDISSLAEFKKIPRE